MAKFNVGDTVSVNSNYSKDWEQKDGSELKVLGKLGTVKGFTSEYVEVAPLNSDLGGWYYPHLFLAEELDAV